MTTNLKHVEFVCSQKNPLFKDNIFAVTSESCLKTSNVLNGQKSNLFIVAPEPRRYTLLRYNKRVNLESRGLEYDYKLISSTEKLKRDARRKALFIGQIIDSARFSKQFYSVFVTLTKGAENRSIRDFLKLYKQDLKRKGINVVYHFWVLEFGKNGNNPHYHINLLIEGKKPKKLPKVLFPERFWNQKFISGDKVINTRTDVQFVKKSVYRYMTKYFTKDVQVFCVNHRNTGFSSLYSNLKTKRL